MLSGINKQKTKKKKKKKNKGGSGFGVTLTRMFCTLFVVSFLFVCLLFFW